MKKGAEQLSELNLVFEDEEVEKKSDAIAIVSTDLQFGAEAASAGTRTFRKEAMTVAPVAKTKEPTPTPAPNIHALPKKEAPAIQPVASKITPKPQVTAAPQASAVAPSEDLQEKMRRMEIDTQVKVLMAEFKTDILTDLLSDIKLLEYQMGGLLNRMYGKHPYLKQEILMLKKLLADFAQKKRK